MITLLLAAALGQCSSRGYGYAAPAYYRAQTYSYAAPAQTYYQAPAQQYAAPAYNYSLVGDMLRQESAYQAAVKSEAKLDILLKLLTERVTPPPPPQPQPEFQQPYASPQQPSKAPPVAQYEAPLPSKQAPTQFEAPYPTGQFPTEQQPPYGTKPPPSSPQLNPSAPSFESSAWVPPPPQVQGGYGGYGGSGGYSAIAAMTRVFQNRCVSCHVGEAQRGSGIKLLELDGQLANLEPYLGEIGKAVSGPSPRMPKEGPKLTPQELYAVLSGLQEYAATSRGRQNVLASFGQ